MACLLDTDVLIDYLRGYSPAVAIVEKFVSEISLSAITVGELFQGVRDGRESVKLREMLSLFPILPVTGEIAEQAGLFSRKYRKSHGCGLADCLIAATAEFYDFRLFTLNEKHYPMLKKTFAPYSKAR